MCLLLGLPITPSRAQECGAAGDAAALKRDWQAAITHYLRASDDPRCPHLRAIYLHNAAIAARRRGEKGTQSDRCAPAEYFEQVLATDPAAPLAASARAGLADALAHCPPDREPWQPRRVVVLAEPELSGPPRALRSGLDSAALSTEPNPPDSTDATDATEAAPSLMPSLMPPPGALPAFDPDVSAMAATDSVTGPEWLLLGAAGASAAGAGVAWWLVLDAHDQRQTARAGARRSSDPAVWQGARQQHDAANTQGTAATIALYTLLAATTSFGTWGVLELLADEDDSPPERLPSEPSSDERVADERDALPRETGEPR